MVPQGNPPGEGDGPRNLSRTRGLDSGLADVDARDGDAELMLAFRDGDTRAFDALFTRWGPRLARYLERMLRGDRSHAEELVQEAFLRVHRARANYQPQARFSTWLYRIATNLALNELRRPRQRDPHASLDQEHAPELAAAAPRVDEVVHARREGEIVREILEELPENQRAALLLATVEGCSYAEIAETLDVSEKAVKALVHRARSGLAKRLAARREGA